MKISLATFIFCVCLLVFDLYVYQNTRVFTKGMSPFWQRTITIFYWSYSILTILTILGFRQLMPLFPGHISRSFVLTAAFIGLTAKVFPLLFLLIDDLIRGSKWLYWKGIPALTNTTSKEALPDGLLSRSEFLAKLGGYFAFTPFLLMTWGIISGAHNYTVRRRIVKSSYLPKSFHGLKVLQISDIHTGSFWDKNAVMRGIQKIIDQQADIIFFTGDLVNNKTEELNEYMPMLSKIQAPLGVYSVLGNHDYGDYVRWDSDKAKKENLKAMKQGHKNMGWKLLLNEHTTIERNGEKIGILGVENWGAGRFSKYGDLKKTYEGTETLPYKILLSHDPTHWDAQIREYKDIDLTLSGHTHGMQFGVEVAGYRWSPCKYRYDQWADLYQKGRQFLYVNRGFGYIGYPGRVGILPEITLIELQKE